MGPSAACAELQVVDIGNRLELFVDTHRIASLDGVRLKLHPLRRAETVLKFAKPWEGPSSAYITVFRDGDIFRMYYRAWDNVEELGITCYAESKDGIHWTRPKLRLYEWDGSKDNNIVWKGIGTHNFTPFRDSRPSVANSERYKALGRGHGDMRKPLYAFASPDGIHWGLLSQKPVLTDGAFDSQNLAFWDPNKRKYVSYFRISHQGYRGVALAESDDFLAWSETTRVDTGGGPPEHFYTNATIPYFRATHYYFAFPKRFVQGRKRLPHSTEVRSGKDLPVRLQGISEGIFMSSRDGVHFDRTFREALIRPGRDRRNWADRSTMTAWGILQTAPDEMSIYFSQHYRHDSHHLRRGVFRLDGIASAHAGFEGGELVTKPIRFSGGKLMLNYSTSASGSIRVEIQDLDGKAVPGYTRDDAQELFGDEIAEAYSWTAGNDVSTLAGKPLRLRFMMKDCDLFSYRFAE